MSAKKNRIKHVEEPIELILRILQTYNPARQTMNQHAVQIIEEYRHPVSTRSKRVQQVPTDDEDSETPNALQKSTLQKSGNKTVNTKLETTALSVPLEPDLKEFIERCACEIYNNQGILRDFTDLLYAENPSLRPALKPLYSFYFYYAVFELPREQNFQQFKDYLGYLNPTQALPLLRIVWGGAKPAESYNPVEDLNSSLYKTAKPVKVQPVLSPDFKNILDRYFDVDYVSTYLTTGIISQHLQAALQYIKQLQLEFEEVEEKKVDKKQITQPEPFKLSTPKRKIVEVEVAPTPEKHAPLDSQMLHAKYSEEMEKKKQALQKTQKKPTVPDSKYDRLARPRETFATETKQNETKPPSARKGSAKQPPLHGKAQKTIEKKPSPPLEQIKSYALPPAVPQKEIKLNKAQILKENALLEKKLQQEAEQLQDFIAGRKDSVEFETWKAKMEARDQAERRAEVEVRKIELQSLKAKVQQIVKVRQDEKMQKVQQENLENLQLALEIMEQEEQAMEELREKNQQFQRELNERLQQAKESQIEEKQRIVAAHKEELAALKDEAQQAKLIEKVERQHYIKQIKAMLEVQSANRAAHLAKKFDPSSYEDLGLFDQMSITELRERLSQMKDFQAQLLEKKRREIEEQKKREDEELEEKRQRIEQMKAAIAATKQQQRLGSSVYEGIVDQVKKYTQDLIENYKADAEMRRAKTEQEHQRIVEQKEQTASQVADLKSRLKQMRDKNSTSTIYKSGVVTKAGSALEKTRIQPAKRIDPKFNEFERTQSQLKQAKLDEEYAVKKKEKEEEERLEAMKRHTAVMIEKQQREAKRKELARKDPFKAKLMHVEIE